MSSVTTYTIESESIEEIGNELAALGIVRNLTDGQERTLELLDSVLDGVETATQKTAGRGNQQGKIAEYAGLDDEYSADDVGKLLDALVVVGRVEKDGRLYVLDESER